MPDPAPQTATCPDCGASLAAGQARCWLCQRKASAPSAENPYTPPRPIASGNLPAQFSLSSLFLVMTLVAVCLGVFMQAPGLGVLFGIVATPALIRTMIAASYQRQAGAPLTALEKVGTFFISWFIMGAIGLASFVAFAVVCVAGAYITVFAGADKMFGRGEEGLAFVVGFGVIVGLIAAIPLTVWLLRLTRPAKAEK